MSDNEEPEERYATQEEAIAAAIAESDSGDIISIHEADCAAQVGEDCDCQVLTITVGGAQA